MGNQFSRGNNVFPIFEVFLQKRTDLMVSLTCFNYRTTEYLSYTKEGDNWWANIDPRDLYGDFCPIINSTKITIGNTAPLIQNFQVD